MSKIEENARHPPIPYSYGGMQLLIGTYKANGRIDISIYPAGSKRVFAMEYVPVTRDPTQKITGKKAKTTQQNAADVVMQRGEYPPENVIKWTLDKVFARFFLPALFKAYPSERKGTIHFSVLGAYALHRLQQMSQDIGSDIQSLRKMIELWGDMPMADIIPANCGKDIASMDITPAKQCVSLLRRIYPIAMVGHVEDLHIWSRYTTVGHRASYSHDRRVRSVLLHVPLAPGQSARVIKRCVEKIYDDIEPERYLAALIIITVGVHAEEVCALRAGSKVSCGNGIGLLVDRIVVAQGSENQGKERVRGQRHVIRESSPKRVLGVSDVLTMCWERYCSMHPDFANTDRLLLTNPTNRDRILAPADYRRWLDDAFGDLLPAQTLVVDGKKIVANYDAEDYFLATAKYLLVDQGGYASEELRYHYGDAPKQMDGRHYAGFDAPAETRKMGCMQTKAMAALCGSISHGGGSASNTTASIAGIAGYTLRIHIEIYPQKILETARTPKDLMLRLSAMGFSGQISANRKDDDTLVL